MFFLELWPQFSITQNSRSDPPNQFDLIGNIWTNDAEIPDNGIDDDHNGFPDDYYGWNFIFDNNDTLDWYGHGTMVAGTIGAVGNNSEGLAGVAWNVKIMPLTTANYAGEPIWSAWYMALKYAKQNGADITNTSAGIILTSYEDYMTVFNAYQAQGTGNMLNVFSAGNDAANLTYDPRYFMPAEIGGENVLTVSATDKDDFLADFSNFGGEVDIAAPGKDLPACHYGGGYIYHQEGTSLSAPLVAGAAALVLSRHPELKGNPAAIRQKILKGGEWVGRKRLNVYNALQE